MLVYRFNQSEDALEGQWANVDTTSFIDVPKGRVLAQMAKFDIKGKQVAYLYGGLRINDIKIRMSGSIPLSDMWYVSGDSTSHYYWGEVHAVANPPGQLAAHTATLLYGTDLYVVGGFYFPGEGRLPRLADSKMWRTPLVEKREVGWTEYTVGMDALEQAIGHASISLKIRQRNGMVECIVSFGGFVKTRAAFVALPFDKVTTSNRLLVACPDLLQWQVVRSNKTSADPAPRALHSAILHNDSIFIFGGLLDAFNFTLCTNSLWSLHVTFPLFQHSSSMWTEHVKKYCSHCPTPSARFSHSAVVTNDPASGEDVMLIFGGYDGKSVFDDLWQFTFATSRWRQVKYGFVTSHRHHLNRFAHTAVMIGEHMI